MVRRFESYQLHNYQNASLLGKNDGVVDWTGHLETLKVWTIFFSKLLVKTKLLEVRHAGMITALLVAVFFLVGMWIPYILPT